MTIRDARPADAEAILAIYGPVVSATTISFETDVPTIETMRQRIAAALERHAWLASEDAVGRVDGYAYASRHRERGAYRWSVDVSVYVRDDARGQGLASRLYTRLFDELVRRGYYQAFAGITLPNAPSVGLHESLGFEPVGVYRNVGYKHGAWRDVGWWQRPLQPLAHPR